MRSFISSLLIFISNRKLFLLLIFILATTISAQQNGSASPWIGKWILIEAIDPEGVGVEELGVWHYYSDGTFSSQLIVKDQPKLEYEPSTAEEFADVFRSYRAGFGTYTVNETGDTLTYEYQANMRPHRIGQPTKVFLQIEGNKMTQVIGYWKVVFQKAGFTD